MTDPDIGLISKADRSHSFTHYNAMIEKSFYL